MIKFIYSRAIADAIRQHARRARGKTLVVGYRLLTFNEDGVAVAGFLANGRVHPLGSLHAFGIEHSTVLDLLESWPTVEPLLAQAAETADPAKGLELRHVQLLAPILYPHAIYCAAANYRDHMRAMARKLGQADEPDSRKLNSKPYHFVIPGRTCICGPEEPIRLPSHGTSIDWEIELAAVIGRPARNVPVDRALTHVAAYTIGNDLSVRDRNFLKIPYVSSESLFRTDFIGMKGWDRSCTIGPWLVPASEIPDPQALDLKLWLDGELMQDSSTSQMVFSVAEQIAYLSSRVTLHPGDLLMTGTPAGTGMEQDRFLRIGETVRMQIGMIGEMSQQVVN